MNWIEQNKSATIIIGITVVVSGALIFLGMGANSDAELARKKELTSVKKINILQAAKPYPSAENEEMLAENLSSFAADTKKFQEKMLAFRPDKMRELSANEFSGEVSAYTNKLTNYYSSKGITLPEKTKCYFGMDQYAKSMANEKHTSYLSYNREALEWLFTVLADSGIDSLNNVYRDPVAETLNSAPVPVDKSKSKSAAKSKAKPQKGNANSPSSALVKSVYDGLPIEITFTGTEASLQRFITEVAAGDKYFFSLKYLKVQNAAQDPVVISKVTFPSVTPPPAEAPEGANTFDGVEITPETGVEFEGELFGIQENKEIIKQVIGDEKIIAFLLLELVHFKDESHVVIPSLKEDSPEKVSTK